jgi:hypothetical protein
MQSIMQRCLCGWCQSDNYIQCHTDFSLKGLKCVVFQTCSYLRLFYLISLKKIKNVKAYPKWVCTASPSPLVAEL